MTTAPEVMAGLDALMEGRPDDPAAKKILDDSLRDRRQTYVTDAIQVVDFDAYRAERDRAPIPFRIDGVTYDLPPTLPAAIAVDIIRLKQSMGDDEKVDIIKIVEFCEAVFGTDLWKTILDRHRVALDEIPHLLEMVLEAYTSDPKEAMVSPTSETPTPSSD